MQPALAPLAGVLLAPLAAASERLAHSAASPREGTVIFMCTAPTAQEPATRFLEQAKSGPRDHALKTPRRPCKTHAVRHVAARQSAVVMAIRLPLGSPFCPKLSGYGDLTSS